MVELVIFSVEPPDTNIPVLMLPQLVGPGPEIVILEIVTVAPFAISIMFAIPKVSVTSVDGA